MKKLSNPLFLLSLITILAAILRLLFLNIIPAAIGGDELTYILTSKSVFLFGSDITRSWNPLSIFIFNYPPGTMQAELPYFFNLPIVGFFPFSLFAARITTALFSIGIVPLMYFIGLRLFKNKKTALFAAFLTAINPWMIYIGRTAYEQAPATFFFLLALLCILSGKSKIILVSILALFLAFYAYIGTKVFFLPFVFITTWYSYFILNKKRHKKELIIVVLVSCILVGFFAFAVLLKHGDNRTGDLLLPTSPQLSMQVDVIRRSTIENPISSIYENKLALFGRVLLSKFFKSTSFDYLFITGDQFFSISRHGLFYVLDFVFLVIGALVLLRKNQKLALFLFLLFLASLIPQLLHSADIENFTPHLLFLFPVFILTMAYGAGFVVEHFRKYSKVLTLTIVILYGVLLVNFMQIYLFQFPLNDYFDFRSRVLSNYVKRASSHNDVIVYSTGSFENATKYEFYTNNLKSLSGRPFNFGNVTFTDCTDNINFNDGKTHIISVNCNTSQKMPKMPIAIASLKDGGATFKIFGNKICKESDLIAYPNGITLHTLNLEKLSDEIFCKSYIVRQEEVSK